MAVKLEYFDVNGLVEPIRYILHYSNQKFEDIRHRRNEWREMDIKKNLPYGQLPMYYEGERSLNQSLAIARYAANKNQLVPSDLWEQAVLDAVALTIYDLAAKIFPFAPKNDEEKKKILDNQTFKETLDFFLSRFEKELLSNNGHFGVKLSWVDFVLVGIIETIYSVYGVKADEKYPNILALGQEIRSLPGVKEYVASRKPYVYTYL